MGRGVTQAALSGYGQTQQASQAAQNNANSVYNELFPQLESQAANPQGIGPQGLAAENTASQQSLGGSQAGATEAGNLAAARTRNVGGFSPAIAESSRAGGRQLSQNAVGIQSQNEQLKQQQRQQALNQLQGLYGTTSGEALQALGLGSNYLNAATNASNQTNALGWAKFATNVLGTPGPAAGLGLG